MVMLCSYPGSLAPIVSNVRVISERCPRALIHPPKEWGKWLAVAPKRESLRLYKRCKYRLAATLERRTDAVRENYELGHGKLPNEG